MKPWLSFIFFQTVGPTAGILIASFLSCPSQSLAQQQSAAPSSFSNCTRIANQVDAKIKCNNIEYTHMSLQCNGERKAVFCKKSTLGLNASSYHACADEQTLDVLTNLCARAFKTWITREGLPNQGQEVELSASATILGCPKPVESNPGTSNQQIPDYVVNDFNCNVSGRSISYRHSSLLCFHANNRGTLFFSQLELFCKMQTVANIADQGTADAATKFDECWKEDSEEIQTCFQQYSKAHSQQRSAPQRELERAGSRTK